MGTLRDEAFEKLDYLSQLTEIVISPHNEILASIPERIELDIETIKSQSRPSWGSNATFCIKAEDILDILCPNNNSITIEKIASCFDFEMSEDLEVDLEKNEIQGCISLVKKTFQLDDKVLLELAIDEAVRNFGRHTWDKKRIRDRTITVLNTFEDGSGVTWAQNNMTPSAWDCFDAIKAAMFSTILENKWRVRDTNVIVNIGNWIKDYMANHENNTGLVNLLKLKLMVSKNQPVYSVDEVKSVNDSATNI